MRKRIFDILYIMKQNQGMSRSSKGTTMVKTVSSAQARASFGDMLNSVYYTKEPVIVEKKGKAMAVLVSPELFQRLMAEDARDWAIIQEVGLRNADQDSQAVFDLVTKEVEAVRRERVTATDAN